MFDDTRAYMMKGLLISIRFMEYVDIISKEMSKILKEPVDTLIIDTYSDGIGYYINKFTGGKYDKIKDFNNQRHFFDSIKEKCYDYIVVIVGRSLSVKAFETFLKGQKHSRKILYLFDDVKRVKEFRDIAAFFDVIYSFDRADCKKYGFRLLPLFYCDMYKYADQNKNIDFSCIGGLHSEREQFVKKIISQYPEDRWNWEIILVASSRFSIMKEYIFGKRTNIPDFIGYHRIPLICASDIMLRSKCTLDMPYPSQKGLTLRTIESLGANTKLITTNKDVVEYDFYDPNNILVVDMSTNVIIPNEFVSSPYKLLSDSTVNKYSLNTWIHSLLDL